MFKTVIATAASVAVANAWREVEPKHKEPEHKVVKHVVKHEPAYAHASHGGHAVALKSDDAEHYSVGRSYGGARAYGGARNYGASSARHGGYGRLGSSRTYGLRGAGLAGRRGVYGGSRLGYGGSRLGYGGSRPG